MNYLKKIKAEAKKRNVPFKKLADSISIPEETLKRDLKNNALSINQLHIICDELQINVSDLFVRDHSIELGLNNNLKFLSNKAFC